MSSIVVAGDTSGSVMDKALLIDRVKEVLKGIDRVETESEDGWWETSDGAGFGARKLLAVIAAIEELNNV